jgi:ParB family chromosome partitioning protein
MPKSKLPTARLKSMPLNHIDTCDDTYRITTRTTVDDLLASIPREGVLNPPFVVKKSSEFAIVSGFRRIAACTKLGVEETPVRILEPNRSSLDYLRVAIADNTYQRPLDMIETSRSLHKLAVHFRTSRGLVETAASLGLPTNPAVVKKIQDLCLLPDIIQDAIMAGTISLSMAMDLKKLRPDCAVAFVKLFNEFKLSLNKQREIMSLVKEISRRDGISEQKLLEEEQLQHIVHNPDLDRNQKARQLRTHLRQRRFPRIVKAETEFEQQRKQLSLGNAINIIPPKDFEGLSYTITMSFSSIDNLQALYAKLGRIIKHPSLKKIIER